MCCCLLAGSAGGVRQPTWTGNIQRSARYTTSATAMHQHRAGESVVAYDTEPLVEVARRAAPGHGCSARSACRARRRLRRHPQLCFDVAVLRCRCQLSGCTTRRPAGRPRKQLVQLRNLRQQKPCARPSAAPMLALLDAQQQTGSHVNVQNPDIRAGYSAQGDFAMCGCDV